MKIEFTLLKKMPLTLRLFLFIIIEFAGLFFQYNLPGGPIYGTAIIIFGAVFVSAKNYTNKPSDIGLEDWKPVSENEFTRIKSNLEFSKNIKPPFYFRAGCGAVIIMLFLFSLFSLIILEAFYYILFIVDILIIIFPAFFTGMVKIWTPYELKLKMERFTTIMENAKEDKNIIVTPYLRLDKDKKGREIPEDIRLMIEPKRKPEDFVGIQFQAAINNGQHGAVPYMYAVFLCRGKGRTYNALNKMSFDTFIKEAGGDKEYGTIVVRQITSGGGYHTTNKACAYLYKTVKNKMIELLPG